MSSIEAYGAYLDLSNRLFALWHETKQFANQASNRRSLNEAIDRFDQLSRLLMQWPVQELERRHRQSMLALFDDTISWVEARRDGGDVERAWADLEEAWRGTYLESCRFVRSVEWDQRWQPLPVSKHTFPQASE